jgi:Ca-activated chloride channel family protein
MRAAITPVLALTALVAAALAPRVYAAIGTVPGTPGPDTPVVPTPMPVPAPDLSHADGVVVDVKLDRTTALAGGTLRAELTLVTPDAGADAQVLPSDVVLVLDTSGSMSGQKLADAKRAAHSLLNQLGESDRAAIVGFDGTAQLAWSLQPVTARAHHAVDRLGGGGSTNMIGGLQTGFEAMGGATSGRSRRVVLLSDGHPDSAAGLEGLAQRFAQRASPLTTVGIGSDYDPQLMQTLADAGTGNFYWAGPNMALDQVFADEFRAARFRFASDTRLRGRLGEGVLLTGVSGYEVAQGSVGLGDLFAGQRRTLFVDVMVPDTEGAVDLGALELSWTGVGGAPHHATVALGSVEVTAKPALVARSLDADVWEKAVVQEEYNAVRKLVSSALARGDRQQAQGALEDYRLRNAALNEVVGSTLVVDNLSEVEALEEQIQTGAIDQQGVVDLATKSYQSRRSGQAYSY